MYLAEFIVRMVRSFSGIFNQHSQCRQIFMIYEGIVKLD